MSAGHGRLRGPFERRTPSALQRRRQRELRDDEKGSTRLMGVQVHVAFRIVENPQRGELSCGRFDQGRGIADLYGDEDQQPESDPTNNLGVDRDRG